MDDASLESSILDCALLGISGVTVDTKLAGIA